MTGTYDWNPMPHVLDIRCPACRAKATFEFAEVVRIALKRDVPFFQNHPLFEYALFEGRSGSGRWHGALFFAGLHVRDTSALRDLPDGYEPSHWAHSRYWHRSHGQDLGTVICAACDTRRRHTLQWPADAFFQVDYRGNLLWAFNRESAVALRDFVQSTAREPGKWSSFLLHVPQEFLTAKARPHVVKLLDRLLLPSAP